MWLIAGSGGKAKGCRMDYVFVSCITFSLPHNHPPAAQSQTGPTWGQHLAVQLAVGLPEWKTTGSTSRQQRIRHNHTEHGVPQGCVLSPLLTSCIPVSRGGRINLKYRYIYITMVF